MKKRLLSALLAASMMLTMVPSAFATNDESQSSNAQTEVVLPDGITAENFEDGNTVYDGTNFHATMMDALKAVAGKENAVLYCQPGADVGSMTHGHVCASLTVYGNGAFVSGGENDFEVDTFKGDGCANHKGCPGLQKDLTITINNLNCSGVWGQRTSDHTINIVMNNCENADRVYLSGTTGVTNVTINGNTYTGLTGENKDVHGGCAIYSNAAGAIKIDGCEFNGVKAPINLNHKSAGEQSVTVNNTTFTNCALLNNLITDDEKSYISPIRVLTTNKDGSSALQVDGCTFEYTSSEAKANGDILIGDGRASATTNSNVTMSISNTEAEVQFQAPRYHDANGGIANKNNLVTMEVKKTDSVHTSLSEQFAVAKVDNITYASLKEAVDNAPEGATIILLKNVTLEGGYQTPDDNGGLVIKKSLTIDYASLKEAVDNAPEGATIILLKNVTLEGGYQTPDDNGGLVIKKSLTIDGQNKFTINAGTFTNGIRIYGSAEKDAPVTVALKNVTVENANGGGRCVDTRGGYIHLTLDQAKLKTTSAGNNQPLTIGGSHTDPITVNVNNSTIEAGNAGYPIVSFNPWNGAIADSIFSGYCGIYFKGSVGSAGSSGSYVTAENTTFDCPNVHGAGSNDFGVFVFQDGKIELTATDCKINAEVKGTANQAVIQENSYGNASGCTVTITGVESLVNGTLVDIDPKVTNRNYQISGGHFTSDPSAFLADGKVAVESDKDGYAYMVADASTEPAEVVPEAPQINTDLPADATDADKELANSVEAKLNELSVDSDALKAAAGTVAQGNAVSNEDGMDALKEGGISVNNAEDVTIVVQPYLDIILKDASNENDGKKAFSVDITPKYRKVATTAADLSQIVVKGEEDGQEIANAVIVTESMPLAVNRTVEVAIALPKNFAPTGEDKLYIHHQKNGLTYVYEGTITGDADNQMLTFTNPHGFSLFTITTESPVAKIGNNYYATLTDAVSDVEDGQTIELLKESAEKVTVQRNISFTVDIANEIGNNYYATLTDAVSDVEDGQTIELLKESAEKVTVQRNISFTVDIANDTFTGSIEAGSNYSMTKTEKDGKITYTFTRKSSGSNSSGSSNRTLTFNVNGGSELKKLTKAKGTTIDLSDYTPTRTGYTFAGWYSDKELTEKVTSVKLNDNTTVYAKWTKNADETVAGFTDVKVGDWFAEEVQYVVDKGLMSGTSKTTFAPSATTTRGMIVAILHRLEKEPAATASAFTDVKAGAYYEKAINWAAANEIVKGMSETIFAQRQSTGQQLTRLSRV